MTNHYQHTQIGYFVIVGLAIACLFCLLFMVFISFNWITFATLVFFSICLALFATLTVDIGNDTVEIRFGIGLIRKKFALKDIDSCQVVKNPWYYGWGIRLTPQGWLYNVSGLSAVEINLRDGKKYRLGTDMPQDLAQAIQVAIGKI